MAFRQSKTPSPLPWSAPKGDPGFGSLFLSYERNANGSQNMGTPILILWMDEILHHLGNHDTPLLVGITGESTFQGFLGGAGFCPSTVWLGSFRLPLKAKDSPRGDPPFWEVRSTRASYFPSCYYGSPFSVESPFFPDQWGFNKSPPIARWVNSPPNLHSGFMTEMP